MYVMHASECVKQGRKVAVECAGAVLREGVATMDAHAEQHHSVIIENGKSAVLTNKFG